MEDIFSWVLVLKDSIGKWKVGYSVVITNLLSNSGYDLFFHHENPDPVL